MDQDDTARLISACVAGDEIAFEELIRQYQSGVFNLSLSILNDPHEAAEAAQDAFIAVLAGLKSYTERSSFKAWLYRITLNTCRSRLRKRKVREKLAINLKAIIRIQSQSSLTPEESLIQTEKEAALLEALGKLDEKHRLPIVLRYFNDLPITEIATILKLNEGTVHSRLHNARERLRFELEQITEIKE